jgi:5'-nucleotidase
MKGNRLKEVLEIGQTNKGSGGYLQTANVEWNENQGIWEVGGKPLDMDRTYSVVMNDYLLKGEEKNLGILGERDENLSVSQKNIIDIRKALINQLKETYSTQ